MLATQQNKRSFPWLTDILFITLFLGIFYTLWIGSHALFTPDEGRYSEVAREMVTTGDYITPRVNGVAFLDKPILYYWLQAVAIKLFGLKEWALRFWPALTGILGCLAIYIAGRTLFNRRTGILSALILATSPLYFGAAHYANLDLEVAVFISNSLLCFLIGMQLPLQKHRTLFLIAGYIFSSLAALTKGLIGVIFPAMIIGTWIILLNRWAILQKMRLFTGICIFLCIVAPWYILVQKTNPEFLHFFFVTQQISRFLTTADFNNKTVIWFYIPIILLGFFPWSAFMMQAFSQKIKSFWKNRQQNATHLFLLLWFFIIFIFFSIPHSKTIGYILPVFPCLALLTGHYLSLLWGTSDAHGLFRGAMVFALLCCPIISVFCIVALYFPLPHIPIYPGSTPYLITVAIIFFIGGISTFFFAHKKNYTGLFLSILIISSIFLLTLTASLSIVNQKTVKPLALLLKPHLHKDDEVVTYYKYFQDLPIYLERRISIVADWNSPTIPQSDNWVRELWYGMAFQDTKDWLIDEKTFWERWNSAKHVFVLTNTSAYDTLKTQTTHVYLLAKHNDIVLISNHITHF